MGASARQGGFTLLELLMVMTIAGILGAIALPQYSRYKERAFDTRALSDLRSVAMAEESYFMDSEHYLSCSGSACTALPGVGRLSKGVDINVEAKDESFVALASHPQGTGRVFEWDSDLGGLQE